MGRARESVTRISEAFRAEDVVLAGVDRVVTSRWDLAQRAAAATTGSTGERIDQLKRSFARELATVGAAAGATAATPLVGTGVAMATAAAELSWFTLRAGDLIMAIAAVHGHRDPSVEERRAWVLSILAFGGSAAAALSELVDKDGGGRRRLPVATLLHLNRKLGRKVMKKYGARRGAIALGRALPLGIGAAVGGSANYALVRTIANQADAFFREMPKALGAAEI